MPKELKWSILILLTLCLTLHGEEQQNSEGVSRGIPCDGKLIDAVELRGIETLDRAYLLSLISIFPGEDVNIAEIRSSIKRLYLTEWFESVEVFCGEVEGKNKVIFDLKQKPICQKVLFPGAKSFRSSQLLKILTFSRYMPFDEDDLNSSATKLRDFYVENGFPDASVEASFRGSGIKKEVIFNINEGHPWRISKFEIIGDFRLNRYKRWFIFRFREGDVFTEKSLTEGMEKLKQYYNLMGYLTANFTSDTEFNPVNRTVKITINGEIGTPCQIKIKKVNIFDKWLLKKITDISGLEGDLEKRLNEAEVKIRNFYAKKGYHSVKIERTPFLKGKKKIVELKITRGPQTILHSVEFNIQPTIPKNKIIEAMGLKLKDAFPYNPEQIPPKILNSLAEKVVELYKSNGFPEPSVDIEQVQSSKNKVFMKINITEGQSRILKSLEIEGINVIPQAKLNKLIGLKQGNPVPLDITTIITDNLIDEYSSYGFYETSIQVNEKVDQDGGVNIKISVEEGKPSRLGTTIFAGNYHTRTKALKSIAKIKGENTVKPASIEEIRRNLIKTDVFSNLDVRAISTDWEPWKKDLLINLSERSRSWLDMGAEVSSEGSAHLFFEFGRRNFLGTFKQLSIGGRTGTQTDEVYFSYSDPWFLHKPVRFRMKPYFVSETKKTYELTKFGLDVGVNRSWGKLSGDLSYRFENISYDKFKLEEEEEFEKKGDMGKIDLYLTRDNRNDYFDPKKGSIIRLNFTHSNKALGSDWEFNRGTLVGSVYFSRLSPLVLALSGRIGMASPFGDTQKVPPNERFYLGGAYTMRGFELDAIGPKKDETPLGGEGMLLANLELRFPIWQSIGGAIFCDLGNVWDKSGDIDVGDLRKAGGVGARYNTPIGPIRLDVGFNLDKKKGESWGQIYLTLGHPF